MHSDACLTHLRSYPGCICGFKQEANLNQLARRVADEYEQRALFAGWALQGLLLEYVNAKKALKREQALGKMVVDNQEMGFYD